MATAYIDASGLVAVAFNEPRGPDFERRLSEFDSLLSSNFLEAEVRSAFANPERGRAYIPALLSGIQWIIPDRPLVREIDTALAAGYLRGGDLWHIAVSLYFFPNPDEVTFLTLDNRQGAVATALGFRI